MSVVPLMWRDWWDDFEPRPSRLLDQHFGLGLNRDDLLSGIRSPFRPAGYVRPWRTLGRQDSGLSAVTADKDKFQVLKFIVSVEAEDYFPLGIKYFNYNYILRYGSLFLSLVCQLFTYKTLHNISSHLYNIRTCHRLVFSTAKC